MSTTLFFCWEEDEDDDSNPNNQNDIIDPKTWEMIDSFLH